MPYFDFNAGIEWANSQSNAVPLAPSRMVIQSLVFTAVQLHPSRVVKLTVPVVLIPSPQAMEAEKSLAVPLALASVKVATAPLKAIPSVEVTVMPVPGAFELPLAAMALAKTRRYACIVALGAIVRGETPHFDYVASECASGLQLAAIETGVPVSFGVLTVDTVEQAEARIPKAADAVRSALEMADLFARLRASARQ